jgi:ribosome biogenesis GTPase A
MGVLEHYAKNVKTLKQACRELSGIADKLDNNYAYKTEFQELYTDSQFADIIRELEDNRYEVSIIGSFNVGKSTFINAILGREILPSRLKRCTSTSTYIEYSKTPEIIVTYRDNRTDTIKIDKNYTSDILAKYVSEDHFNPDILRVNIKFPLQICKDGLVLIDTPGYSSPNEIHDEITNTVLKNSKAIIVLMLAKQVGNQQEMFYLQHYLNEILTSYNLSHKDSVNILFVINQMDSIRDRDKDDAFAGLNDVLDRVHFSDQERTKLSEVAVKCAVSSIYELYYKKYEDYKDFLEAVKNKETEIIDANVKEEVEHTRSLEPLHRMSNFDEIYEHFNSGFFKLASSQEKLLRAKNVIRNACMALKNSIHEFRIIRENDPGLQRLNEKTDQLEHKLATLMDEINPVKAQFKSDADKCKVLSLNEKKQLVDRIYEEVMKDLNSQYIDIIRADGAKYVIETVNIKIAQEINRFIQQKEQLLYHYREKTVKNMEEIIEEQFNLEHKIEFINYENLEYRFIFDTNSIEKKGLGELIEDEQNRYGKIFGFVKGLFKKTITELAEMNEEKVRNRIRETIGAVIYSDQMDELYIKVKKQIAEQIDIAVKSTLDECDQIIDECYQIKKSALESALKMKKMTEADIQKCLKDLAKFDKKIDNVLEKLKHKIG